jgi:hypothetical protein
VKGVDSTGGEKRGGEQGVTLAELQLAGPVAYEVREGAGQCRGRGQREEQWEMKCNGKKALNDES